MCQSCSLCCCEDFEVEGILSWIRASRQQKESAKGVGKRRAFLMGDFKVRIVKLIEKGYHPGRLRDRWVNFETGMTVAFHEYLEHSKSEHVLWRQEPLRGRGLRPRRRGARRRHRPQRLRQVDFAQA